MYDLAASPIKFAVAPMLDWTDRHCRYFHRLLSKQALLYTEMINAQAIIFGPFEKLLKFDPFERPIAVQLGGSDIKLLQQAARVCANFGYDEINLNVGCPSPRVQSGSFGACLMKTPQLVADLVSAMKAVVSIPISVKCRIGVDDQDSEEALDKLISLCEAAGAEAFWVHARKAWLKGLSPKENRQIPPLDYERVYQLKKRFSNKFIGLNGGITSIEAMKAHLKFVDGVMIGREIYHNPSLLAKIDAALENKNLEQVPYQELIDKMVAYSAKHIELGGNLAQITRHMLGLFHGQQGAKYWRSTLAQEASAKEAKAEILQKTFEAIIKISETKFIS